MAKKYDIEVALGGHDEGAGNAVDALTKKLRALKAEQKAEKPLAKFLTGGPEKQLEALGSFVGGAKFGIAALAIDQAAKATEHLFLGIQELREGTKSFSEIADEAVRMVPVLGSVYGAIQAIKGSFDGSAAKAHELAKELAEAEKHAKFLQGYANVTKEVKETAKGAQDRLDKATMSPADYEKQKVEEADKEKLKGLANDRKWAQMYITNADAKKQKLAQIDAAERLERQAAAAEIDKINSQANDKELEEQARQEQEDHDTAKKAAEAEAAAAAKLERQKSDTLALGLDARGQHLDAELERIRGHYAEQMAAAKEDGAQRAQLAQEQAAAEAKARADAENDSAGLRSGLRQKELAAEGRELAAKLEAIRADYADKIRNAKTDADRELLRKSQSADEAAAGRADEKKKLEEGIEDLKDGGQVTRVSTRYTGAREQRNSTIESMERHVKRSADNSEEQLKALRELNKLLTGKTGAQVLKLRDA